MVQNIENNISTHNLRKQLAFTRKVPTLVRFMCVPMHFTWKSQETVFMENFTKKIFYT